MKGSKSEQTYSQRKISGRKPGKKSGSIKLDRKSSRGMIYENEELRLRTININAEVERGQSDIRKLRRENEQLRREIWSLRDEYDRLNKRFKANKYLPDSISEHGHSDSKSYDSDSCDTCRGEPDDIEECLGVHQHDREESALRGVCLDEQRFSSSVVSETETSALSNTTTEANHSTDPSALSKKPIRDNLHVNFDHLSIVSEENFSNSDGNRQQLPNRDLNECHQTYQPLQQKHHPSFYYDENFIEIDGARLSPSQCLGAMSLPDLTPLTPITRIEMVTNQLNDFQSIVPPLSYFENIVQQHMGTAINSTPERCPASSIGDNATQTNGWDYRIQSPFSDSKSHSANHSMVYLNSTSAKVSHLSNPYPLPMPMRENSKTQHSSKANDVSTDMNFNNCSNRSYRNPKHFFSPIKPRLKLDAGLNEEVAASSSLSLAGSLSSISPPPAPPPVQYCESLDHHQNCDPPDVFVTNALASPFYLQTLSELSLPTVFMTAAPDTTAIHQFKNEPIYATAQKNKQSLEQNLLNAAESSKNLLNLEQIINEIGTISEDILKMQLEKGMSPEKVNTDNQFFNTCSTSSCRRTLSTTLHTATTNTQTNSSIRLPNSNVFKDSKYLNQKPYRSEMNLLLSYNGRNRVIIPLAKNNNNTENDEDIDNVNNMDNSKVIDNDNDNDIDIDNENIKDNDNVKDNNDDSEYDKNYDNSNDINVNNENDNENDIDSKLNHEKDNENDDNTDSVSVNHNDNTISVSSMLTKNDIEPVVRDPNSPSPSQLPTPMAPFPTNLMYLGFDRLNPCPKDSGDILYSSRRTPSAMTTTTLQCVSPFLTLPSQLDVISPQPPQQLLQKHVQTPISESVSLFSNGIATQITNSALEDNKIVKEAKDVLNKCDQHDASSNSVLAYSNPDLSTSSLAKTNPLKSRIFSKQKDDGITSQVTRSFDASEVTSIRNGSEKSHKQSDQMQQTNVSLPEDIKNSSNDLNSFESSSGMEFIKRKPSKRVSIVCNEGKLEEKCTKSNVTEDEPHQQQKQSSSVDKLDITKPSLLVNLKHTHSTLNSPHSNRGRCGLNTNSAISVDTGVNSSLFHHGHHHHHHHHHHNRKLSQDTVSVVEPHFPSLEKSIVNNTQYNNICASEIASPSPRSARYKCSRRHSEGTVSSGTAVIPIEGGEVSNRLSIRTGTGGHHHHHHHHHQDSNQETATSISERNISSRSSSRDSSTSLSVRSQRRKISISSHTGGKIPWCGCWGNGCV